MDLPSYDEIEEYKKNGKTLTPEQYAQICSELGKAMAMLSNVMYMDNVNLIHEILDKVDDECFDVTDKEKDEIMLRELQERAVLPPEIVELGAFTDYLLQALTILTGKSFEEVVRDCEQTANVSVTEDMMMVEKLKQDNRLN